MKASETSGSENLTGYRKRKSFLNYGLTSIFGLLMFFMSTGVMSAHCDTMDGPLVSDAKKALDQNNVNYALKWVPAASEKEIRDAFGLAMKVRGLSADAKELSEKYFFDILVRIHRTAEGVPFTGVKPSGTPVDEKILAADKSLEIGDLSPLKNKIPADDMAELKKRFEKALSLKNFAVNDVAAGREYIEAYVQFFKFAEGEESHNSAHSEAAAPSGHVH